jgi:glycosyl transferase, family 25
VEIFVISLRAAHARRTHVVSEMAAAGLRFHFVDAVEAGSEPERHFVATNLPLYRINARRSPLPGEIACYASHRAVWRRCVELGTPIVVLEDDFHLRPSFASALLQLEALTREFGFVRIQSTQRGPHRFVRRPDVQMYKVRSAGEFALYYLAEVPLCMLAYSIDPSAAAALIEGSAHLTAPVDKFMQRTWEHGVPLFCMAPHLVDTATVFSDHSTIGVRPRKSWSPLLLTLRSLDKVRGRIRRRAFNATQLRRLGFDHGVVAGNRLLAKTSTHAHEIDA